MMNFIKKVMFKMTGNRFSQIILARIIIINRKLMGIGSGSFPETSGEAFVLNKVLENTASKNGPIIIFDVGANKGQFLNLILDSKFVENLKIHCFEPATESYGYLRDSFENIPFVTLENLGVDDHIHKGTLFFDKPDSIFASIYARDVSRLMVEFDFYEDVNFTTLDEYCLQHSIETINYLKIDVEGNELNVLKGASTLLSRGAIKALSFEFGSTQIDSRTFFKDIYEFLIKNNMGFLYRITPSGYLSHIPSYSEELEMFFTTNYLAVFK